MGRRLCNQLLELGCDMDPVEFRRVLAGVKRELFPSWIDEHLVCTVEEADRYCKEVRKRVGVGLPRLFILTQLLSVRKVQARVRYD